MVCKEVINRKRAEMKKGIYEGYVEYERGPYVYSGMGGIDR